jgi:hypothetical protein
VSRGGVIGSPDRVCLVGKDRSVSDPRHFVLLLLMALPVLFLSSAAQAQEEGRQFFLQSVLPKLGENMGEAETSCLSCHGVGYLRPNLNVYEELLRRLAIGDSPENNAVIYKVANLRSIAPDRPNHPGGPRCESIDAEPCKTIRQWWRIEFGHEEEDR